MFGLSPFERELLLLCAGVELDSKFAAVCAQAQGDARRSGVTFAMALALLREPHWSALTPVAPLRRWRLVEIAGSDGLMSSTLRIDERVLHYIAGVDYLDSRLQSVLEPVVSVQALPRSQQRLVTCIANAWSRGEAGRRTPAIICFGSTAVARENLAVAACNGAGLQGLKISSTSIPRNPEDRSLLARLCERECALSGHALIIRCDDGVPGDGSVRNVASFCEQVAVPVIISTQQSVPIVARPHLRVDVEPPSTAERHAMWTEVLGESAHRLNGQLDLLASRFDLDEPAIRAALRTVPATASAEETGEQIWNACRTQARAELADLAERIEPRATWDDLVLPAAQLGMLREIAVHARKHAVVFEQWGFGSRSSRGHGVGALFAGPSGTGKTMAAEVLANELRLDLFRVDLSQVVSKYIGETEKNLHRIFDAGERSGAILLFDEADALFGKRSDVRDSHDRYANIESSYLLQRMKPIAVASPS